MGVETLIGVVSTEINKTCRPDKLRLVSCAQNLGLQNADLCEV